MPADDYTAAVSGGLKLKSTTASSKVSKSHKKKRPKPTDPAAERSTHEAPPNNDAKKDDPTTTDARREPLGDGEATPPRAGKTEAELRHEERRRKRLDERLKREGTKTHKERVEELNRYLSNLSEHHDMPRIGPG